MKRFVMLLLAIGVAGGCSQAIEESAKAPRSNLKQVGAAGVAMNGKPEAPPEATSGPTPRIIHTARIELVVEDLDSLISAMNDLVTKEKGYLADSTVTTARGGYPSARWVARIPSDRYTAFLDAVSELGVPVSRSEQGEDVTEQFVDLEARIAASRKLEERLLKFAEEKSGDVKDLLEVEKELTRVRSEIEQMEGKLRFLTNRTSYATVTVEAREEKDYVPPRLPTFDNRAATVWWDSLELLKKTGEGLALTAIAVAPWLPVAAIVLVPPSLVVRRARRRRALAKKHVSASLPEPPSPAI